MLTTQPSIRSALLSELRGYLSRQGVLLSDLASSICLLTKQKDDPVQEMSLNGTMALFDEASRRLKDPAFGINFARSLKPGSTGLLGEIVLSAPTVRECLVSTSHYINVFMSPFSSEFKDADGVGRLTWTFPPSATAPRIQYSLFLVALLIVRVRTATGRDWVPLGVDLEHSAPDCPTDIRSVLGPRARFNAGRNCLHIDGPTMALPMPGANPVRFAVMRDLGERVLKEQAAIPPDAVASARDAITALLSSGKADLESVAARLGLTSGALQWRLERAGTTFERELTHERRMRAEQLLRETNRSMTEIAYEVGFSDPSAFTRAAQRWFGMPPRDWRRSQRFAPGVEEDRSGS